ncbi:MAG TPA: ABC transporter ATP-binding protein [Longimicrobiales bacterium]
MTAPLLVARDLRHEYNGRAVVDVEQLEIASGEILAVLGANGAGKSTLFRLLLALEKPTAGTIRIHGKAVGVFQRPYLFEGTVADNIAYGLRASSSAAEDRTARVQNMAETFGLADRLDARVHELSGGEAQRVALARALVLHPDVLLLDEPTATLDAPLKRQFREDLLRSVRMHARSAMIITHDSADAFGLADRIAVMENGRIVQTGTPDDLLGDPRTPFVAAFTGAELLLNGSVTGVAEDLVHVALREGGMVWASLPHGRNWQIERGARVHVAYRPEDVVLSSIESNTELSARNHFRLRVASLSGTGGLVRLRLEGQPALSALVTRTSCESLGIRPGRDVIAHLKAAALRALPA